MFKNTLVFANYETCLGNAPGKKCNLEFSKSIYVFHLSGKEKPEESDADLVGNSRVHDLNTDSFKEYVSSIFKDSGRIAEGRSYVITGACFVILTALLLFLAFR